MPSQPNSPPPAEFDAARLYLWVKALEGKVNNLLREVNLMRNDTIKKNNQLRKELKTLGEDLLETRRQQEQSSQKMDLIIKELKNTAGIEELMVLRKYIELWNPLTFVTQRDLERAVETKILELKKEKK